MARSLDESLLLVDSACGPAERGTDDSELECQQLEELHEEFCQVLGEVEGNREGNFLG